MMNFDYRLKVRRHDNNIFEMIAWLIVILKCCLTIINIVTKQFLIVIVLFSKFKTNFFEINMFVSIKMLILNSLIKWIFFDIRAHVTILIVFFSKINKTDNIFFCLMFIRVDVTNRDFCCHCSTELEKLKQKKRFVHYNQIDFNV